MHPLELRTPPRTPRTSIHHAITHTPTCTPQTNHPLRPQACNFPHLPTRCHHAPPTLHPPTPLLQPRALRTAFSPSQPFTSQPPPSSGGGTALPTRRTAARGRPLPALSPPSLAARGGGGGGGGGAGGVDVTAARGRRYLRSGADARAPLRRIRGARRRRRWRWCRRPPPAPPPRRRPRTMRSARALLLALALRVCALDTETPSGERSVRGGWGSGAWLPLAWSLGRTVGFWGSTGKLRHGAGMGNRSGSGCVAAFCGVRSP